MWVGDEKRNQPGEAYVRMGRMKALYKVHKDFLMDRRRQRQWSEKHGIGCKTFSVRIGHDV